MCFYAFGNRFQSRFFSWKYISSTGEWETKCWTKSFSVSHSFSVTFFFLQRVMFLWHYFTYVPAGFGKVLLGLILSGTSKTCVFEKIYTSVFSLLEHPLIMQASTRFWLRNFPWRVPLSVGITWDLKLHRNDARTTTAKHCLLCSGFLKSNLGTLWESKCLGLNP